MTDPRVSQITELAQSLSDDLDQQKALVAQLWTPRAIPNLLAWYDVANAPSVHLTGSLVDQVDDQSGNGYHAAAGTTKPTYNTTACMGKPGISGGYLQVQNLPLGGNVLSVFALASFKGIANARLVSFKANADGGDYQANSVIPFQSSVTLDLVSYKAAVLSRSGTQPVVGSSHTYNGVSTPQINQPLMDDVFSRVGTVFDGTQNTLYMGNVASDPVSCSSSFGSQGLLTLLAGNGGTLPWGGALSEVIVVKGVPSADDRERINTWLARHWNRVVVVEGDSLPHAGPAQGGYAFTANLPDTFLENIAVGGSNLNQYGPNDSAPARYGSLTYRAPFWRDVRVPKNKNGKEYVLYFAVTNNLGGAGTMADYVEAWGQYALSAKAAGFDKVVTSTVISRTDAGQANDVKRAQFNAAILASGWAEAHGIDAIADFAADPIMGVDQAPVVNPSYFSDLVHPNAAGHARLAPIFAGAVNG